MNNYIIHIDVTVEVPDTYSIELVKEVIKSNINQIDRGKPYIVNIIDLTVERDSSQDE